jgi:transcriptional regulator with PAS, ATPase and Fis domain
VTGNPVFDEKGEIRLVVVNERDITELNRLRNELEESRQLTRRYQWELSNLQSHQEILSRLIFRSKAMQRVVETAMKVAKVSSTVVIQGESGVGKGLLAKIIHQASLRRDGPFIRVDCGAIPESLIESELFGYEEGAFTGARPKGKPGYFEMADGGTLFLDDIGELPLNVQVKLLRFLEDNEVIRIGGTQTKQLDVRVIAATHRDLEEMVRKGTFRKDLFFRLNVVFIQIPPLRERPEDIPPLLHFFLKQFNQKCDTKKMITPQAVDLICKYEFPGNVRELANLVEQLVVLSPEEYIDWQDLPQRIRSTNGSAPSPPAANDLNLPKAVAALEKTMIIQALKLHGSQRKAARPLGIDQSTLARKIKRYAIGRDSILHHDE